MDKESQLIWEMYQSNNDPVELAIQNPKAYILDIEHEDDLDWDEQPIQRRIGFLSSKKFGDRTVKVSNDEDLEDLQNAFKRGAPENLTDYTS